MKRMALFASSMLELILLFVALVILGSAASAQQLTEILYVQGCGDSHPPHTTSACFAGRSPKASVELSLRGLNFPPQPAAGSVRAELVESLPLAALEGGGALASVPRVRLACDRATASALFPTQLLTCTLPVPFTADTAATVDEKTLSQWQAASGSLWFDVVLAARPAADEPYRDLAVLRHAVQVDLKGTLRAAGLTTQATRVAAPVDIASHPLERLYATKPSGGESGADAADTDDEEGLWVELGIGGLKKELRSLFRRVFLSRLPSLTNLTEALDIQHVRGVILYGPPGNGKTLIARSLFKLLGPDTRLTVVNAADVLSKYVGESEKNLRDVFGGFPIGTSAQAETDHRDGNKSAGPGEDDGDEDDDEHGDGAPRLHVLVIDEFESLFRRRGHSEDESSAKAAYDGITNTLLSLMDGVETRNDLLVVGLTNRLQAIDSAMLRPGRFEVLIEVPAPDVPGREEIFFIHTAKLWEEGFLAEDVSLFGLAVTSGGFSGSDIAGTVRAATSYALLRFRQSQADGGGPVDPLNGDGSTCDPSAAGATDGMPSCTGGGDASPGAAAALAFEVTSEDLAKAMADIRSAKDEASSLTHLRDDGADVAAACDYDDSAATRTAQISRLVAQVLGSRRTFAGVAGISGAAGTGKSLVAKQLTAVHRFDTVRFLSCRRLVELSDRAEQLAQIRDALADASRVGAGLVVLDDFDLLQDSLSGYPVQEGILRNMLYEFRNRPHGVSRSLGSSKDTAHDAVEAGAGRVGVSGGGTLNDEGSRRILLVTATRADALAAAEPDLRLRVRPVRRAGMVRLLQHYNISEQAATLRWRAGGGYPPSLSYRTFLRITDMALWQCALSHAPANNGTITNTPWEVPAFFAAAPPAKPATGYFITSQAQGAEYAAAVRSVSAAMGLSDSFSGWNSDLPRTDLFASVMKDAVALDEEAEETRKVPSDADENAADFGDEVLW